MQIINKTGCIFIVLTLLSCADSVDEIAVTLKTYLDTNNFETGAVIACAASDNETGNILTFYYPKEGATDARLYETSSANVDNADFSNYNQVFIESEPIFNGFLRRFPQKSPSEKWMIVTFEMDGEIKISNPIRTKQITKPTLWEDIISINQSQPLMPIFSWQNNFVGDNAIYFQIVSDADDNLLSGTYTNENQFQYYKLDNVVLNVTQGNPPNLQTGLTYNFTLMDVSIDNWVNVVTLNKSFTLQ
jgi:hypothetical protein